MKRGQIEDANICQKAIFKHALEWEGKKRDKTHYGGCSGKWTKNTEPIDGAYVATQKMFFYLHMNDGRRPSDVREVLESANQANVSISGISIFPARYPVENCLGGFPLDMAYVHKA